jgi:hypothetical protein
VSTILRALQRVEGEKNDASEMGALREGVVPPGEPLVRERGRHWRFGITAFLAAILLGFFLWWMVPTGEVPRPSEQELPPVASEPAPARSRGGEVAAAKPPAPIEEIGSSAPARTVSAPPPLPAAEESAPPVSAAEPPPSAAAEPSAARQPAAVLPPPRHLTEEPKAEEPLAEVPPSYEEAPPPATPADQPPPRVAEPPKPKAPAPARVAALRPPKVTVKKTVWHPVPERRVARIEVEGRKGLLELHEGDAVGTLVVAEIQPSGVVFLHGGERLHRKVGTER